MSYALLGRLRAASYKGVKFLIKDSSISFGQKTVVHRYPNSNKTLVEYLGLDEQSFELDLYIHGSGLLEKRKKLKAKLEEGKDGLLIHPYEGEFNCAVVGRPTIRENDPELGICRFTVTFQKTTPETYPSVSGNTKPSILRAIDSAISAVSDTFDNITTNYGENAIAEGLKLNDIADTFDNAMGLTYKLTDKANELKEDLLDFKAKITTYIQAPSDLATALSQLWGTFAYVATSPTEQFRITKQFYTFGNDDRHITQSTLERTEKAKNAGILNNAMQAIALAESYGTASLIEYDNSDQLDQIRQEIEDQYDSIRDNLDVNVLAQIDTLRALTLQYLDNLEVAEVINYETQLTSVMLLGYRLYGTVERYDEILGLNSIENPSFISGTVKVLNE